MRITLLGSGAVSRSLASGFARTGHELTLGTRDSSSASAAEWLVAAGPNARVTDPVSAVGLAQVLVMALPGRILREVVPTLADAVPDGTIIIDPTNPVAVDGDEVRNAFGENDSAAEFIQRSVPQSRVVKAFSQIPAAHMGAPGHDEKMPLRICGDDVEAKSVVAALGEALGWRVRDLGPLERARALENAAVDWIRSQRGS